MIKIAIMTWFHYENYGTNLQAYALQRFLRNNEYDARLIDYIPLQPSKINKLRRLRREKILIETACLKLKNKFIKIDENIKKNKSKKFIAFRKEYINFTEKCKYDCDLFELNNKFDYFICGSDQIWSPAIFDSRYFLDFVIDNNKKISYSSSIGTNKIFDSGIEKRIKDLIKNFKAISVRESEGKILISKYYDRDILVACDPTLLLTRNEWNDLTKNADPVDEERYLLCYFLGSTYKYIKDVKKIAKRNKLKIKIIPTKNSDYSINNIYVEKSVGPLEFLNLIKNSKFICTDSYHAMIFSLIFQKQFCIFKRFNDNKIGSQNSRIYNMLNYLDLENNLFHNSYENFNYDIDVIDRKLSSLISKSKKFLFSNLTQLMETKQQDMFITNACSGCGACIEPCPKKCIDLIIDDFGFFKYRINQEDCIHCNICKKVCGFSNNKKYSIDLLDKNLYAFKAKNENIVKTSSSGGASYIFNLYGINNGYEICGCEYNYEKDIAEHSIAKNIEDLLKFKSSKYLQSYTKKAFSEILNKNTLKSNKKFIITGLPCQIAGINNFLNFRKKRDNYILIDVICHGVPTYNLWNKFLKEKNLYRNLKNINFRYKFYKNGIWNKKLLLLLLTKNNCKIFSDERDSFYRFFNLGEVYAESCFSCPYRTKTGADVRLGDFWGKKYKKDNNGVSMIIPVTKIGEKLIKKICEIDKASIKKEEIGDYIINQQTTNKKIPYYYDRLMLDLKNKNKKLKKLADEYCSEWEFYHKSYQILKKLRDLNFE